MVPSNQIVPISSLFKMWNWGSSWEELALIDANLSLELLSQAWFWSRRTTLARLISLFPYQPERTLFCLKTLPMINLGIVVLLFIWIPMTQHIDRVEHHSEPPLSNRMRGPPSFCTLHWIERTIQLPRVYLTSIFYIQATTAHQWIWTPQALASWVWTVRLEALAKVDHPYL